jgi:hypothetical protein
MEKVGKPKGLIRYSSLDAIAGKRSRLLRPRTVFYPAILLAMIAGLGLTLATKEPADVTVLRGTGAPFTENGDGRMIAVVGLDDDDVRANQVAIVAPENPLVVGAGTTRSTSLFVLLPRQAFEHGQRLAQVTVTDGKGWTHTERYRLLGPSDGRD